MAFRISNQYLLRILTLVAGLGRTDVSARVLVESWTSQGRTADDIFFLHFDVLFEYGFLQGKSSNELTNGFESLMAGQSTFDMQLSITQNGTDFLHRYLQP